MYKPLKLLVSVMLKWQWSYWTAFIVGWVLVNPVLAATTSQFTSSTDLSRPDPDGIPTEVTVSVYLLQLKNIQAQAQEFNADLVVLLHWKDPRLAIDAIGTEPRTMALSELWHPQLSVLNILTEKSFFPKKVLVDSDGTVTYRQRYIGTLTTALNLQDFPLDSQQLTIETVASGYDLSAVQLRAGDAYIDQQAMLSLAGWHFVDWVFQPAERTFADDKVRDASLVLKITVKRVIHYYLWRNILPLILIVMMASAIFWLNPEDSGAQLGLATGTVFSLIAFYFSLGQTLPPLNYLTRMDHFVIGSTLIVFLCFAEAILTARFTQAGRREMVLKIDYWSRLVHIVALVLLIYIAFLL